MAADNSARPVHPIRRASRAAYDRWALFSSGRAGLGLMFAWAVAEATVWPIIPDVLLAPMAAVNKRRFYLPLAAAIAGSALGGALLYMLAYISPGGMLDFVRHLPLVSDAQVAQARSHLAQEGAAAYLFQPWSGVPFKVWAAVGASMGLDPLLAIPTFIAGRAFRMAVFALAARLVGGWFSALLRDYWLVVSGLYVVFFLIGLWQVSGLK